MGPNSLSIRIQIATNRYSSFQKFYCQNNFGKLLVNTSFDAISKMFFYPIVLHLGAFKYYVIKEVGGWGQKTAIFDDLQYCKSSKRWVGGPKKVKNMMT